MPANDLLAEGVGHHAPSLFLPPVPSLLGQSYFFCEMASYEQRELIPDEMILSAIFSGAPDVRLASCNILSNTFDTCTFSVHLDVAPLLNYPKDLLVLLETSGGRLATVASLQRLGHAQLFLRYSQS